MAKYLEKVKKVKAQIPSYKIQQISRSENAWADRLARLATSQMVDLSNNVHLEMLEACSIEETEAVLCTSSEPS